MHLKSLELFGFKSFPSKTILKFDPGITAIVGPNGCGKSNVFDAIKWALGEQSPKSLRGSKMEDVIFNGTDNYPPLNYAEVTLNFSNEDRYLPIDYKEVAVTRRLYRSGESQYFINKSLSRLKDIEELFLGTGIGEASYSFVEQGKVETLLSYKPEEKRLIFDEASGIVKYKEKKKETLRKLKDTEDNVLRLDDILSEVKRQIRYLERQVEKAKKYKEINKELIETEKKIASINLKNLEEKINAFLDETKAFKDIENAKDNQARKKNKDLDDLNKELKSSQKSLEETNSQIISLTSRIENHKNLIQIDTQRQEELRRRLVNLDSSAEETRKRISLQETRVEEERKALFSLDSEATSLGETLGNLKETKQLKASYIEEARKSLHLERDNVLHYEEERIAVNNSIIETETHLRNLLARKKRLTLDKARLDEYLEQHKEKTIFMEKELTLLKDESDVLKKNKNHLSSQLKKLDVLMDGLGNEVIEKEKLLVELNSYLQFLKDLKIKYEEFPQSKKVTIIFDEDPRSINKLIASLRDVEFRQIRKDDVIEYKAEVEAKIISLPEEELLRRIDALNGELRLIKSTIDDHKEKRSLLAEKVSQEESIILEKDKILREKLQEKDNLNQAVKRFEEEFDVVGKELSDCLKEIAHLEEERTSKEKELTVLQERLDISKNNSEENQTKLSLCSEEVNRLDIEIAKKEAETKALGEHKESVIAKVNLLEDEQKNLQGTLASLEEEKKEVISNISSLKEEVESLHNNIAEEKEKIESLNTAKVELESGQSALEEKIEAISATIKDLEKDLEKIRVQIYNKKLEVQKLDFEKTKIIDYLKQVYNIDFIVAESPSCNDPLDVLQEHKERFKKRLDSLGEVNLVAIEEFDELNSRFEFLNSQRQDLLTSKESLKKAIQKINRTSKEIFLDIFTKIEEEFKKHFRFLFGGGRAQLILLDKENVLESGVEIEVQPPGKKLQNVSLLSGGEKALTAIALIFSILKVRPSPLCVLDEIDAPLDEANVDRFNQLLKGFSPAAQFIIVTHSKRTMSKVDVLYGVTMQEKGVSKLVSVKFAQQEVSSQ